MGSGHCNACAHKLLGMKRLAPLMIVSALAATQPACYGSYSAFHAVHKWNGTVSSSKVVKSAVHFGLYILPVYELCLLGDIIIFNTIEFITGERVFK